MGWSAHADRSSFEHALEHLPFLLRATEILGQSLDYRQTLQNVCAAAVGTVADICIVYLGSAGETALAAGAHRNPSETPHLLAAGSYLESEAGCPSDPVCEVIRTGETFFVRHIDEKWIEQHAAGAEHAAFLRRMKYTSMIVVPLRSQVFGITGALALATSADGHEPFKSDIIPFAEGLGRLCASAIGKARLYEEAHTTATTYQTAALPRIFPQPSNVEFYAHYECATKALVVGGDWYDAFRLPDGRIGVSIGDASGHGLSASILMSSMKNALRSALIMEPDISRALQGVDYLLRSEEASGQFCTALLGIIDLDASTLRLATCGHPGPKIWSPRTNTVTDPFTDRHVPLGLHDLAPGVPASKTVRLDEGAFVVFYTDGLVEYDQDIIAAEESLEEAIARQDIREAPNPAAAIRHAVMNGRSTQDDAAILVVKLRDGASRAGV